MTRYEDNDVGGKVYDDLKDLEERVASAFELIPADTFEFDKIIFLGKIRILPTNFTFIGISLVQSAARHSALW